MIRCSAPLPEGLDNLVLEKMLEPAPCLVPSKEGEGGNKEAESGPHSLLVPTGGMSAFVREDNQANNLTFPLIGEGRGLPPKI